MSGTIVAMQVYVDGNKLYQNSSSSVDTFVSLSTGSHFLVLQAWNSAGQFEKSSGITFNVSGTSTGVTVTSPTSGSTVAAPLPVKASAVMSGTVTTMQVYVDGNKLYQGSGSTVNTTLSNVGSGAHTVVVQSWNSSGQFAKSAPVSVTVSGTSSVSSSPTAPAGSTVYSNIDQMSGWQNCGACAGIGGSGPVVPFSMSQFQSSPSMDGSSALFWLGTGTAYAQALWWKQLGANAGVSHFIYDTYFYYTDANAPQALEFDVNQSVGGFKYIFGTQCAIRGSHTMEVWDNVNVRWSSTGVACPAPPTYKWNHLVWELERVNGQLHFIAFTLNGVRSYVNRYYAPRASSASELNVAFQMDGNFAATSYKVWLDKVTLSAW
jgi:Bacterial Ig domain